MKCSTHTNKDEKKSKICLKRLTQFCRHCREELSCRNYFLYRRRCAYKTSVRSVLCPHEQSTILFHYAWESAGLISLTGYNSRLTSGFETFVSGSCGRWQGNCLVSLPHMTLAFPLSEELPELFFLHVDFQRRVFSLSLPLVTRLKLCVSSLEMDVCSHSRPWWMAENNEAALGTS